MSDKVALSGDVLVNGKALATVAEEELQFGVAPPKDSASGYFERLERQSEIGALSLEVGRLQRRVDAKKQRGVVDQEAQDAIVEKSHRLFRNMGDFLVDYVNELNGEPVDPQDEEDRVRIKAALRKCSKPQFDALMEAVNASGTARGDKSP